MTIGMQTVAGHSLCFSVRSPPLHGAGVVQTVIDNSCDTSFQETWDQNRDQAMEDSSDKKRHMTLRSKIVNLRRELDDHLQKEISNAQSERDQLLQKTNTIIKSDLSKKLDKSCEGLGTKSKKEDRNKKISNLKSIDSNGLESKDNKFNSDSENGSGPSELSSKRKKGDKVEFDQVTQGDFKCPLCQKTLDTSHAFTVHIRQHNPNDHSHTCRICGKTLSSASSLDRHMLVHSGERPFKCKVCNMAFTTNGNMHRHMRTHNDEESSEGSKQNKELKPKNLKRKSNAESDLTPVSSPKKGIVEAEESKSETPQITDIPRNSPLQPPHKYLSEHSEKEETEKMNCPVCGKTFLCKYGLQTHMETHPNDPVKCVECGKISSNYSTFTTHLCIKKEKEESAESLDTSPPAPAGFQDLTFVDFSTKKFSLIAKYFCEHNTRRPSSAFHTFECTKCKKAFPCGSALYLHKEAHRDKLGTYCPSCKCDFHTSAVLQNHQLKHRAAEHCTNTENANLMSKISETFGESKEDFLALFELQTSVSRFSAKTFQPRLKDQNFESLSYFVHGKSESEMKKEFIPETTSDFADIQAIISLTSKSPLIPSIRSSPVAASPASPPQATACNLPESPLVAESANASPETPSREEYEQSPTKASESLEQKQVQKNESNTTSEYICKICNLSFKSLNAKKRHNRSHTQSCTAYSCTICSYTSMDKSTLIRHLRTHNGERPFQCAICSYAFTTKANCERHVRKRHKKVSKHEIRSAMRYNPNMSELKMSDALSSDVSNSETRCKYCSVDFKFNRVLRHHLRSLHNSCNRKPFFCSICKLGFSTKNNCIRHVAKQHPAMKGNLKSVVVANATSDVSDQDSLQLSDESPYKETQEQDNKEHQQQEPEKLPVEVDESLNPNKEPCTLTDEDFNPEIGPLDLSVSNPPADPEPSIEDENELNRVDDIINIARSLVSLAEFPPPQEEPLDLAVHAIDLSRKDFKHCVLTYPKPASIFNSPVTKPLVHLTPSPHFTPSSTPQKDSQEEALNFSKSIPCQKEENPKDACNMTFKMVNDQLSPRGQRPFSCMYCSAGFTLKSNMERHVKRKHPEYARPTRSRNFIPTLSPSNIQKQNIQTLSNKTRDALRVVLSNKVNSQLSAQKKDNTSVDGIPEGNSNFEIVSHLRDDGKEKNGGILPQTVENVISTKDYQDEIESSNVDSSKQNNSNESESSVDLASVSAVIDTANSQEFKQYLIDARNEEKNVNNKMDKEEVEAPRVEENPVNISVPSENSNTTITSTKKRSSYAESPNSVSCPFCFRKFPWTSSLRRHILTHTGQKPYKCPKCPIWFTTKSNCERHLMRKHGRAGDIVTRSVPERPYKCNLCPSSSFSTQGNLKKHFYLRHWTKTGSGRNLRIPESILNEDVDKPIEETLLNNSNNNYIRAEVDDKDTSNCFVTIQPNEDLPEDLKCCCCDKVFGSRQEMEVHVSQQTDLPYKCHLCEESYTKRQDCLDHLKECHLSEYQMLISKKALDHVASDQEGMIPSPLNSSSGNNNNSVNEEDPDSPRNKMLEYTQRKVICAFCCRRFWSTEDLRRHMRTHSGERPFTCSICKQKFTLKHSMLRHYRKHKGVALSSPHPDSTDDEGNSTELSPRSKKCTTSLLYLMDGSAPNCSTWSVPQKSDSTKKVTMGEKCAEQGQKDQEDNSDLIQNLLGIHDSKLIDQMIDSADSASAARLLGVEEV